MKQIRPIVIICFIGIIIFSCTNASSTDTVEDPINNKPIIEILSASSITIAEGDTINLTCVASDIDGDSLHYSWTYNCGYLESNDSTAVWTAPDTTATGIISCNVSDGELYDIEDIYIAVSTRMIFVHGGEFEMGDRSNDDTHLGYGIYELPVHSVIVSDFYMGETELTQADWEHYMPTIYYNWGTGDNYPVNAGDCSIMQYCNFRSIAEGLTPCYSIEGSTNPRDWGDVPTVTSHTSRKWNNVICDWNANGYRLPTEAEWEYAARGGVHSTDNYLYSGSQNIDEVAWYQGNNIPSGTKRVGTKSPNQLGLYDMTGNWEEICWDGSSGAGDYYQDCFDLGIVTDPTGVMVPDSPYSWARITRGGSFDKDSIFCDISHRDNIVWPTQRGFRVVQSSR
ncbi:MAG: SUMF1/EgtB/PvdO family nonheme iron enzyme [Candidatus Delongbacteria bacterium]|nr:SUMF1/EgtB/PvdO family nonheme iron enzyme [Candidatus Delongbacteria bacterium]